MSYFSTPRWMGRGDLRQHVLRQDRRAAAPGGTARGHRAPAHPGLQTGSQILTASPVASHNGLAWESETVGSSAQILERLHPGTRPSWPSTRCNSSTREIAEVCNQLHPRGLRVICAGLDLDFHGEHLSAPCRG